MQTFANGLFLPIFPFFHLLREVLADSSRLTCTQTMQITVGNTSQPCSGRNVGC